MAFLKFVSFFVPRVGILSCVLIHRMVRNGIPRVCFYFCSTEWNSELFSFPQKDSERNSDNLLLFFTELNSKLFSVRQKGGSERNYESVLLFFSMERNSELFSLPRKGSERNSKSFLSRGTAGIPLKMTICSVYFVFRGLIFLSEIPNLKYQPVRKMSLILCSIERRLQIRFSMA